MADIRDTIFVPGKRPEPKTLEEELERLLVMKQPPKEIVKAIVKLIRQEIECAETQAYREGMEQGALEAEKQQG